MHQELKRKSLHLIAAAVPLALIHISWQIALLPLILFTLVNIIIDKCKQKYRFLADIYGYLFGDILRDHETQGSLTGSTYYFISLTFSYTFFCILLDMPVHYLAVIYTGFMIGDAAAALVGKSLGKTLIFKTKTLEGSLAFVVASFVSTAWIVPDSLYMVFLIAILLCVTELYLVVLDDNFFVPLLVTTLFNFFVL
ncbi:MAG: diacylglycerol/polyprenol kinase family protein [Desulfovermiculus sp.]